MTPYLFQFSILNSQFLPPLAAALVAFNPMFVHIMASVNNDTLAAALSSLALLLGARMIRGGATTWRAIALGVVLGCAALSKVSGIALAIAVPFFVGVAQILTAEVAERRRGAGVVSSVSPCLAFSICTLLPVILIAGWWYVRNLMLYGDPTGTTMMATIAGPRAQLPTALELVGEWDGFYKAYWGLFGAVNIPMHEPIYIALEVLLVLAGIGLLLVIGHWLKEVRGSGSFQSSILNSQFQITWMLFAAFAIAFFALVRWTSITLASQGRLLFPVIAPISIFVAAGLLSLALNVKRQISALTFDVLRLVSTTISIGLAALTLAAPFVYIKPAYQTPTVLKSESQLPTDIQNTELYFEDKIRWLGYRVDTPAQRIRPGEILDVTLYWQGLKPLDTNYSAFIKLLGRDDVEVAKLDTYPGGGMWQTTLWQTGDIVADHYRIRVPDTPTSTYAMPTVLRLDVGFWDFKAKRFLDTLDASGKPTGRQRYEAASLNSGRAVLPLSVGTVGTVGTVSGQYFEKTKVRGVLVSSNRTEVRLQLDWLVVADVTEDYTTFVQLFDYTGKKMDPQADGKALNGGFAPRWWRAGDVVVGDGYIIPLPQNFPPGKYTVKFGLYNKDGARMPAFDDTGQRIGDDALSVPVEIK